MLHAATYWCFHLTQRKCFDVSYQANKNNSIKIYINNLKISTASTEGSNNSSEKKLFKYLLLDINFQNRYSLPTDKNVIHTISAMEISNYL